MTCDKAVFIALFLLLAGCATADKGTQDANKGSVNRAIDSTRSGLSKAALTPVEDLNLRREEIPALLTQIKDPYRVPGTLTCDEIAEQVLALDRVLGRDFDAPEPEDERSLGQKAADGTSSALLDTIASESGGLIPFRGVVRRISGARAWDKKVLKAYERGSHRRTFLKGIGANQNCPVPASPRPPDPEPEKIIFK